MRIIVREFDVTGASEKRELVNDKMQEPRFTKSDTPEERQREWNKLKNGASDTCYIMGMKVADIEFWDRPEEEGGHLLAFRKFVRANHDPKKRQWNGVKVELSPMPASPVMVG